MRLYFLSAAILVASLGAGAIAPPERLLFTPSARDVSLSWMASSENGR